MIYKFKEFEAKIVKDADTLNAKSYIQIVDEEDKNIGQAIISKVFKTLYRVKYKAKEWKIKKSDVSINEHGQAQSMLSDLY